MRLHRYIGPDAIRARPRGEPGMHSFPGGPRWLVAEGATFVVDPDGVLRLAPRRSEHLDCASGGAVFAAGEIRFARVHHGLVAAYVSNQSTGYCPDPECWPAVAAALAAAAIPAPSSFSHAFRFRRCPACMQINVVKEDWFVCASCDAELPRSWNFDP
jgi:hypothetical protein